MQTNKYLMYIIIVLSIIISSLFLYFFQIQESNDYLGLEVFSIDIFYISFFMNSLIILGLFIFILKNDLPNNILGQIFLVFVIIWNFIFYKVTNLIDINLYLLLNLITLLPILLIILLDFINKPIISFFYVKFNIQSYLKAEHIFVLFLIFVFFLIYLKLPLSFNFEEAYLRRFNAREYISGISAYFFEASMNSIVPFLSFYAFLKKKYKYFFIALVYAILCFGFIGTKAPIAYSLLLALVGFYFYKSNYNILKLFLVIVLTVLLCSVLEYFINGYSIIADIIVRRAFVIVAQNQTYFVNFMVENFSLKDWIFGYSSNTPITFLIGEIYYNNGNINVNTNAFMYEIAKNGLLGYLFAIFFLSFFFSFLNYMYIKFKSKEIIGIAVIYSLLLTEQSYSTAFISSGVGFLTAIVLLTINAKDKREVK